MPLDSDMSNADSQLHVDFYFRKDDKTGVDVPYIRIMIPGDKTNVFDQPVREDHKTRFPRHWLAFQMQNSKDLPVLGTPLVEWHQAEPEDFTRGQLEELQILKFQTVEQVAGASDGNLQRVGMGGVALREKAKRWLGAKNTSETSSELAEMKAQIAQLTALLTAPPEKRGPGRPPGSGKKELDVNHDDAATSAAGHD